MDYPAWLAHLFTHDAPDWYFDHQAELPVLPPEEIAAHTLRLLEAPGTLISSWTDTQLASGLTYLFDFGTGFADIREVGQESVTPAQRAGIAERIDRLWTQLFSARCTPTLGHLSEEGGPLNTVCYMFWDNFYGIDVADPTERHTLDAAFVEAMGRILTLPHPACQESALHGLGHWRERAPERSAVLIDAWLAGRRPARPELVAYARAARTGCVL